jgi:hypothetical protein
MSSLPETSVWEPAELRAGLQASPAPASPPQFEVSTSAGVPESLLRPARAAAHAAGYAAGWADGMHAAKARAEAAAEQARAEQNAPTGSRRRWSGMRCATPSSAHPRRWPASSTSFRTVSR